MVGGSGVQIEMSVEEEMAMQELLDSSDAGVLSDRIF